MREKKGRAAPKPRYAEARIRFIPIEVWKQARMIAVDRGMTVSQFVIEAIKDKVRKENAPCLES